MECGGFHLSGVDECLTQLLHGYRMFVARAGRCGHVRSLWAENAASAER